MIVVVLNVAIVVKAILKVDLRLLVMEVEFGWVVGGVVGYAVGWWRCANQSSCQTQPC